MSWDMVPGKNREGYPDPTAATALSNIQRSQRGLQSKRAGEHFENLIAASLVSIRDFKGTLTGGRAVVFEAKHTDSDRIEQSRLTDEQVESLSTHHGLGAAAFVLVSVGLQDFFRVPWEVWRDMKDIYGHKHMKLAELEPYRVQYIAGVLKLLEGVELDAPDSEQKGDQTNE